MPFTEYDLRVRRLPVGRFGATRERQCGQQQDARIAALAVKGEIQTPERPLMPRIRRVKVAGGLLSKQIIADRR
jgi:hypothetical protein